MAFTLGVVVFLAFNLTMGAALWFAYRESEAARAELDAEYPPRAPSSAWGAGGRSRGGVGRRGSDAHERA